MSKTKKKSPPQAPLPAEDGARLREQIVIRAFELWQQSGCVHGNDQAHWLQAEREVQERQS